MTNSGAAFFHLARYLVGLDDADTQTTAKERECLKRFAFERKRIVEIGVYEGVATQLLADAMSIDGDLFAIDPFITGRFGICWGRTIARRQVAKSRDKSRIHFIEAFSHDATSMIEGIFDMIFIDADHSITGITRDWADWSDRVVKGGIIALHDTRIPSHNPNVEHLGSYKYFESHIRHDSRFLIVEQVDSLSILLRN